MLRTVAALILSGMAATLTFRVMQPYAFAGPGFLDITLNPKWLSAMHEVQDLMSGQRDVPFGHQWTARTPIVFPWRNLVYWGLGLPLGLTATVGWAAAGWDLIHRRRVAHLVPWVWATVLLPLPGNAMGQIHAVSAAYLSGAHALGRVVDREDGAACMRCAWQTELSRKASGGSWRAQSLMWSW